MMVVGPGNRRETESGLQVDSFFYKIRNAPQGILSFDGCTIFIGFFSSSLQSIANLRQYVSNVQEPRFFHWLMQDYFLMHHYTPRHIHCYIHPGFPFPAVDRRKDLFLIEVLNHFRRQAEVEDHSPHAQQADKHTGMDMRHMGIHIRKDSNHNRSKARN